MPFFSWFHKVRPSETDLRFGPRRSKTKAKASRASRRKNRGK